MNIHVCIDVYTKMSVLHVSLCVCVSVCLCVYMVCICECASATHMFICTRARARAHTHTHSHTRTDSHTHSYTNKILLKSKKHVINFSYKKVIVINYFLFEVIVIAIMRLSNCN